MHIYNDWPWACQSWCIISSILDGYFSLHISIGMYKFHLFFGKRFFFLKIKFFTKISRNFKFIQQELTMAPNTRSFRVWKNPPLSLNFDVYLFNWTNPSNLTKEEYEKPILQQIGPYRFREKPMKTKVRWHPENGTISYRRKSTYYFVEEESVGQLDDRITTINAVAVVS